MLNNMFTPHELGVPQYLILTVSGYVPKGQHFFGERYAQACDHAIRSFEKDLIVKERDEEQLRVGTFMALVSMHY